LGLGFGFKFSILGLEVARESPRMVVRFEWSSQFSLSFNRRRPGSLRVRFQV